MSPVNVALIRGVNNRLMIGALGHVLDFELARRQKRCRSALCSHGVKVSPSVLLPRENNPVPCSPEKIIFGDDFTKHASAAFVGSPNLLNFLGIEIVNVNRPGRSCASRTEDQIVLGGGQTEKSEVLAIRRPRRFRIAIGAGIKI